MVWLLLCSTYHFADCKGYLRLTWLELFTKYRILNLWYRALVSFVPVL